jgi:glycosyltransferase involved in cell wall biosynthesis
MLRATLIMEQHIGHRSYYQNLRAALDGDPSIMAHWVPVTYTAPGGPLDRLPWLPGSLRGTLRDRAEVRRGLAAPAEVLFFNTQVPAVLGGVHAQRRPYVIATDITPLQYDTIAHYYGHKPDRGGPLSQYKHAINRRTLRGAARLLPWSSWVRDSLLRDYGVEAERMEVIPPGIDLERWTPGQRRQEGPLRILFVGGDLERKGGRLLLEIFNTLPPGSAELLLVTHTPLAPQPRVRVFGNLQPNTPELIALFQSADLFVLPSLAEAFGIVAVEAAAAGLPAIVSAVGGLAEIVTDGETGFIVPPGDARALAERLRFLADNRELLHRQSWATRLRAERLFDARRNGARIVAHLREAAYAHGREAVAP